MIQISNLSKVFDADSKSPVYALNDINLEIDSGEIFGIIGLSGAGKSTLIRTINRLEDPSTGRISIDDVDITALSKSELMEARREIGMIFQHFNLLSSRSVAGNVAFPLEVSGMTKDKIETRVSELLKLVGLSDKADSYPSQLSGGQKQRVAIARALANNPKVLLCDEATSALDPNTTKSILKLLKDINKSIGLTIVLITHQMEVIREICNRVAIIEDGEIIELGKVERVFSNPQTQTAKDFIAHLTPDDTADNFFPKEKDSAVIRITYLGESAQKPVISELIRKFDIDANIISGDVNKLMSTSVGHLMIQLLGSKDEIEESIQYLDGLDLSVEVIWHA